MIDTILTCPYPSITRWAGYHSLASFAAPRIALGPVILLSALLMQSCATQEMNTAEKALVPVTNEAEGQSAQQDSAVDGADSAPEHLSFESMYRNRYKTTPDEQE